MIILVEEIMELMRKTGKTYQEIVQKKEKEEEERLKDLAK